MSRGRHQGVQRFGQPKPWLLVRNVILEKFSMISKLSKGKILVVDDEPGILELVTAYLEQEGFDYRTALDGPSGLQLARSYEPDLIVLDIMLPGMDGIELLRQLRQESDVYVIMLTAKGEETDKIVGLSVGADDYLTKPFSPRELVARIKAALRRIHQQSGPGRGSVLVFEGLRIDKEGRKVWVGGELVDLTATEFDLLLALAEHRGMVLSRDQLLEKIWGHDYYGEIRVVDVHIGHIRQKIGEEYIATVRGVGYRFEGERDKI
jgi:two-component system alkaline phosphatase synthesis response regulator PhoP